jgi:hypothetical protein
MGWARQKAGEPAQASDNFRTAVKLWQDAESLTRDGTDGAKLARVLDRRLKAQLASGDPVLSRTALTDLKSVSDPAAMLTDRVWLYNRACLYAQASKADAGTDYQRPALLWLGRALRYYDLSVWDDAEHRDPELAPIRSILGPFLRYLISHDLAQSEKEDTETLILLAISYAVGQY